MLDVIHHLDQFEGTDNASICMLRIFKDVVFRQHQIIREQQMVFFGLTIWIIALLAFIVFSRRN